jgi:2-phosphoglycerate kinase
MNNMTNTETFPNRTWEVLLIGGASGTGKTSVSYRVARHFGVGITEVDDFQIILEKMTTAEQLPALHFWDTHPNPRALPPEAIVENGFDICSVMRPALEVVIASHLESGSSVVLEGDFIHPALASQILFERQPNAGRVKGVIIDESDEEQLVRNFLRREPDRGEQRQRAQVSCLYAAWLREKARKNQVPIVQARPWESVFERVLEVT